MRGRLALVSLAALAWAEAAAAQPAISATPRAISGAAQEGLSTEASGGPTTLQAPVTTDIAADTGALSLNTQVTQAGNVHTIDGGTRAGNNLFHSFSRFDLGQGDFALWVHSAGDPTSIRNVVNRVTGGDPSHIFGTIDSTALPNADFFFINPAGVVFGEGAQVNVPAAAHFSTAQELRFGDGPAFTVATPSGSTFSVANPAAFGFVGGQGDIIVQDAAIAAAGSNLSFSAANVGIANASLGAASLLVAGVGGEAAEVPLEGLPDTPLGGAVAIADSSLEVRSAGGLRVVGGSLAANGSRFNALAETGTSGSLSFVTRDSMSFRESAIQAGPEPEAAATAGTIRLLSGGEILIGAGTFISSVTNADDGDNRSGDVILSAPTVRIGEGPDLPGASIGVDAFGRQSGGDLVITGGDLIVSNGVLGSTAFRGAAGSLRLTLSGTAAFEDAFVLTEALGGGGEDLLPSSGNIEIEAGAIRLDRTVVTSSAFGSALAGGILLIAPSIDVTDSSIISDVDSFGCGDECPGGSQAGRIFMGATDLRILRSRISADTLADGFGGLVFLIAENIALIESSVSSISSSDEAAGTIDMIGSTLLVQDSLITSRALGRGDGGRIFLGFSDIRLAGFTEIVSDAGFPCDPGSCSGSIGRAGDISVVADRLDIVGNGPQSTFLSSSAFGSGQAGNIDLDVGSLSISNAAIRSTAFGSGDPGAVLIRGRDVSLSDFATLDSSTSGSGAAGGVLIELSGSLQLTTNSSIRSDAEAGSTGSAGLVAINAPRVSLNGASSISTNSFGDGPGGNIFIGGDDLSVTGGSSIASTSEAAGDAGNVAVELTGDLLVDGAFSLIATNTGSASTGAAGRLEIFAGGRVTLSNFGNLSSTVNGSGAGGILRVSADEILLESGGNITTDTFAACDTCDSVVGGDIILDARTITLTFSDFEPTPFIASDTFGVARAGSVDIRARETLSVGRDAFIASDTYSSGDAGLVQVDAAEILLAGGEIRSSAQADTDGGNAGTVILTGGKLTVNDGGTVATRAEIGSSGDAGAVQVTMTGQILLDNGVITSTSNGTGAAGTVEIKAADLIADRGARITSSAAINARAAGTVAIEARDVLIDGQSIVATGTQGAGPAGQVVINAPGTLRLDRGAVVSSNTFGGGAGGGVRINSGAIELKGEAVIASRSERGATGSAGEVIIGGGSLTVREGASVNSETASQGNAGSVTLTVSDIVVTERGSISSSTSASGNAGTVEILEARSLRLDDNGRISSTSTGSGAAGDVVIAASQIAMDGAAAIESNAGPQASGAGTIEVASDTINMANGAVISTSTLGEGPAGEIGIAVRDLSLDSGARIASNTGGECNAPCLQTGDAGQVGVIATGTISLRGGSQISSNSVSGSGDAGQVFIAADRLFLAGGRVSTSTSAQSTGESGVVFIAARDLTIDGIGSIETISRNDKTAGLILIDADTMLLNGPLARISSSNEGESGGAAGNILIETGDLKLLEGAQINTTSRTGAAGNILIDMPNTAFLRLESRGAPSKIDTSSGPGTGGQIFINQPYAIISNGGSILALGQSGGANVEIATRYFISSADRTNLVAVSGDFLLEAIAYDVSAGTVNRDLSVIDASGVLRGQCAAVRQTGQVSQLVVRPIGPYGSRPVGARPADGTRLLTAAELQRNCA